MALTQSGLAPRLLRNDQDSENHWLRVKLVGREGSREALGARIELNVAGAVQRRTVTPARSYLSHSELVQTFGLGAATAVESMVVIWPDGHRQPVAVDAVDRLMAVTRDSG